MIAEIVSVGTELLMGQVVNTDAQHIAQQLAALGYQVFYQITVGDNVRRLTAAVHTAIERSDVVVFTGGLGPTDDDLTKETVAAALGLTCEPIPAEMERLTEYFASKGRTMAPSNRKQACFPKDAYILRNDKGTAPGCIMQAGDKTAVLLPGPPRELFPMFDNYALPFLAKLSDTLLYSRTLRIFGMGESDVTYRIRDVIEGQTNPTVAPYIDTAEVTLRVTAQCKSSDEGEALVAPMVDRICGILGDIVYSTNGEKLPALCARLLTEQKLKLACAESCTGGLLTSAFVDIPGSSAFLTEGCITYANEAKMRRLNVSAETLREHGPVSEACAAEMAKGMLLSSGANVALATTGLAGPDGGTPEIPVGTVYIALADKDGVVVKRLAQFGDRGRIRAASVLATLDLLRRYLQKSLK